MFSRHENSFTWLRDADMALPTHCAEEPRDNVTYAPIYMLMFIEKVKDEGPKIYKLDLGGLV